MGGPPPVPGVELGAGVSLSLSEAQRAEFAAQGFLHCPGLVGRLDESAGAVEAWAEEIARWPAGAGPYLQHAEANLATGTKQFCRAENFVRRPAVLSRPPSPSFLLFPRSAPRPRGQGLIRSTGRARPPAMRRGHRGRSSLELVVDAGEFARGHEAARGEAGAAGGPAAGGGEFDGHR